MPASDFRVLEQVSKELKGEVGDKHDRHTAQHRKDRESIPGLARQDPSL